MFLYCQISKIFNNQIYHNRFFNFPFEFTIFIPLFSIFQQIFPHNLLDMSEQHTPKFSNDFIEVEKENTSNTQKTELLCKRTIGEVSKLINSAIDETSHEFAVSSSEKKMLKDMLLSALGETKVKADNSQKGTSKKTRDRKTESNPVLDPVQVMEELLRRK